MFEDEISDPRTLYKLDCTSLTWSVPKQSIKTDVNHIWDVSFAEHQGKQRVFIAKGGKGLFAYNERTGKLEWSIRGKRCLSVAITTDEKGHLFHCVNYGGNRCVQMYTAEGKDLGVLQMEKGEFPGPWKICWCKNSSSLIMAHKTDGLWFISVIALKYPE